MVTEQESQILYSEIESRQEIEAAPAEVPIVDFADSNVGILYQDPPNGLGLDYKQVSGIIGMSTGYVFHELKRQGVPSKASIADPEKEQRRVDGVKQMFEKRHDEIVAKIHSPQARINRGNGYSRFWKTDSAIVARRREQIRSVGHLGRGREVEVADEAQLAVIQALQEERKRVATSILHHEKFSQLSPRLQEVLVKRYAPSLAGDKPETYVNVGKAMGDLSRQRIKQLEDQAMEILNDVPKTPRQRIDAKYGIRSIRADSVHGRVFNFLQSSKDPVSVTDTMEQLDLKNPSAVYRSIHALRIKLFGSGIRIIKENGGYLMVKIPQQLER